jgi:hypothetical protein
MRKVKCLIEGYIYRPESMAWVRHVSLKQFGRFDVNLRT